MIRDSKGLQIVVYGIQRGLGMEVFPVDLIYRPWKHAEGQVWNSTQPSQDHLLVIHNVLIQHHSSANTLILNNKINITYLPS